MKSMGIIRRIDELGRIVIPKEIRKKLRIHDGDNIEISIDELENIILSKYSSMGKVDDSIQSLINSLYRYINKNVILTDNEKIIGYAGNSQNIKTNDLITNDIHKIIEKREKILGNIDKDIQITNNYLLHGFYYICPIIVNYEVVGLIIIEDNKESISDNDKSLLDFIITFFSKYLAY